MATTKTGPNDETEVLSFGPLVCVFCFFLSCFISYLWFLFYLGSISVLLRGTKWAAMTKMHPNDASVHFFSFIVFLYANDLFLGSSRFFYLCC